MRSLSCVLKAAILSSLYSKKLYKPFFFFFAVRGPLTVVASPVVEHRLRTRRLSVHGSRGTNPCPLHRQVDSQPLRHQERPVVLSF